MMLQNIEPKKFIIGYEKKREPGDSDYVVTASSDYVLAGDKGLPTVLQYRRLHGGSEVKLDYLFMIDDMAFFTPDRHGEYTLAAEETEKGAEAPVELWPMSGSELRLMKPVWQAFAALTAQRLVVWKNDNRYCGCCGAENVRSVSERALVCPVCGRTEYPRIDPSVIVGILNGDKMLLTRYTETHSNYHHYALVAGYCETGETPEDTVAREVKEEVGLDVTNIRYYKSQPWPVSGTLLLGFFCELAGDDKIIREQDELSEALWMDRSDMPDRSGDISLTSEMMEMFRTGKV